MRTPPSERGSIGGGAAPRRHGPRTQGTGAPAAAALPRAAGARRGSREMSVNSRVVERCPCAVSKVTEALILGHERVGRRGVRGGPDRRPAGVRFTQGRATPARPLPPRSCRGRRRPVATVVRVQPSGSARRPESPRGEESLNSASGPAGGAENCRYVSRHSKTNPERERLKKGCPRRVRGPGARAAPRHPADPPDSRGPADG